MRIISARSKPRRVPEGLPALFLRHEGTWTGGNDLCHRLHEEGAGKQSQRSEQLRKQTEGYAIPRLRCLFRFRHDQSGKIGSDKIPAGPVDCHLSRYDRTGRHRIKGRDPFYNIAIEKVGHVDDIFKNTRLRDYIFKSFGIDPETFSYKHVKNVLTSDISNADSYINKTYKSLIPEWKAKAADLRIERAGVASTDKPALAKIDYLISQYNKRINDANKLFEMAAAFNFRDDGRVDDGMPAQTTAQRRLINETYVLSNPRLTQAGAVLNREYFADKMKTITEASQMTQFARLRTMLIVSFNLTDNDETDKKIGWAVLQDPNDPQSPIHKEKDKGLVDLARAFNFGADGKIKTGKVAQTAEQLNTMMNLYFSRYDDKDEAADEKAIKNYQRYIGLTKNLEDFLSNAQGAVIIRNFALKAFDITAEEASSFTLKRVFTSDLSDTKSYVYTLKDERFVRLAKAFNFDAEGARSAHPGSPSRKTRSLEYREII